jgi:hypothetical protein
MVEHLVLYCQRLKVALCQLIVKFQRGANGQHVLMDFKVEQEQLLHLRQEEELLAHH